MFTSPLLGEVASASERVRGPSESSPLILSAFRADILLPTGEKENSLRARFGVIDEGSRHKPLGVILMRMVEDLLR